MKVTLSWQPVSGTLFYKVYRGVFTGGPYDLIGQSNPSPISGASTSPALTTYTDGPGTLVDGQQYFYTVSAVTIDGEGPFSSEYAVPTPSSPAQPSGLTGVVV